MSDPTFTHDLAASPDRAYDLLNREWLLTNATGGYAAGTALGCPTRRYHGLLVASAKPPVARYVCLSQIWEQLLLHKPDPDAPESDISQPLELSSLMFRSGEGGTLFAPRGHELLTRFQRGVTVRWEYAWGDVHVSRELTLHHQQQAITLRYHVRGLDKASSSAQLRLHPMVALRDFHSLLHKWGSEFAVEQARPNAAIFRHHDVAMTMAVQHEAARWTDGGHWWENVFYPLEAQRGQDDSEDLHVPGRFEINLPPEPENEIVLTAALGEQPAEPATAESRLKQIEPIRAQLAAARPEPPAAGNHTRRAASGSDRDRRLADLLALAADDFVVERTLGGRKLATILAGYPWFADWGRDTFIALPGLLLTTGRHDEARAVLEIFAGAIRDGLVPNRFDDYDEHAAHYNTVDASLWFLHAALAWFEATGDQDAWRDWLGWACVRIVEAYMAGTGDRPEAPGQKLIRMDDDGLIAAGDPSTQLTWMDAAIGEEGSPERVVFTPRPGKAVEINALWYSGLLSLADALDRGGLPPARRDAPEVDRATLAERYRELAGKVKRSFVNVFWRDELGYLLDHVWTDPQGQTHEDASLRPNQVFALSLPHSPLGRARQRQVLQAVEAHLLTPAGLRTLPPGDPHYHPHYAGDRFHRDKAYHQGTVWPWLIGPYAEAVLRVGQFGPGARKRAAAALDPLLSALVEPEGGLNSALGQLAEIHDAEPPHQPRGCFAQAWSVAEVLRVWSLL
ncbi:MAG: amylo-alpha-1,6-glucosidase [Phycisphaeraceae bacterium]